MRKIIHIDMDAFYASVEEREHPELKVKPLAVGYDGPRGVVTTANYVARRFGVHSAMAISTAKRICPGLVIVPCHFNLYKSVSATIHSIFHRYTDLVEPISLDEAFLDVTENKPGIELANRIAADIKEEIKNETGLTASAGISYCKFLAKIASDYRKPDGLFTVHPMRAQSFIDTLEIEKFWGIGPKTAQKMHNLGIRTGADLRQIPLLRLTDMFGKAGRIYYDFARGIDNRPVVSSRIRKSLSCEETFERDIFEESDLSEKLSSLSEELKERLDRKGFEGNTLTLKVKYSDFSVITRSVTTGYIIRERDAILALAEKLLSGVERSSERRIRLLGIGVSDPHADDDKFLPWVQLSLFNDSDFSIV